MINHMKRTTLILNQDPFNHLKGIAASERRTLSSLTEDLLRLGLAARRRRSRARRSALPSWKMGNFKVDVADRNALAEAMERR